MKPILQIFQMLIAGGILSAPGTLNQSPPQPIIEARLSLRNNELREGESFEIGVEIENVGDKVLLIGRRISAIDNWPFRIEIQLEDTSGHQYGIGGGAYLDPVPVADFSAENGILKWWMPLESHTFIGTRVKATLSGVPPGRYRLHGTYLSFVSPSPTKTLEETSAVNKYIIYSGTAETNSLWVEVRRAGGRQNN